MIWECKLSILVRAKQFKLRRGRISATAKMMTNARSIVMLLRREWRGEPLNVPCVVDYVVHFPWPPSMSAKRKAALIAIGAPYANDPDWDNLGKQLNDCMQTYKRDPGRGAGIIANDKLFVRGSVTKNYSDRPSVSVRVETWASYWENLNGSGILFEEQQYG